MLLRSFEDHIPVELDALEREATHGVVVEGFTATTDRRSSWLFGSCEAVSSRLLAQSGTGNLRGGYLCWRIAGVNEFVARMGHLGKCLA